MARTWDELVGPPDVAVVMPAYNEEGLREFLAEIETSLVPVTGRLAFVVVDDCSTFPLDPGTDNGRLPLGSRVHVVRNASTLGHGISAAIAYREGLNLFPDAIVHVDGDGQFHGQDFPRLLTALAGRNGVVGSRSARQEPWYRRILTRAARVCVGRALTGDDVNSPLRAYDAATASRLLAALPESSVVPHLHFARLHRSLGLDVLELPVTHRARRGSSAIGTTWQSSRRAGVLPSRRLLRLAWKAVHELAEARAQPPASVAVIAVTPDAV